VRQIRRKSFQLPETRADKDHGKSPFGKGRAGAHDVKNAEYLTEGTADEDKIPYVEIIA
jgi:hypothetical protein